MRDAPEASGSAALRRAEDELRRSEERYRSLFDALIEGFCIIEVIFDASGKAVDYRFLEVNPAFEAQTGLRDAQGKLMRELAPQHEAHWFEIYGKVALTGEPAHFVNEAKALDRYYDVRAFRVGGPQSRTVAVCFYDISERKRAEEVLHKAQRLESLGVLAGGIAHDFNNLLASIFTNIELARASAGATPEVEKHLDAAMSVFDRAKGLTLELLTFATGGAPARKTGSLSAMLEETARFTLSGTSAACTFDIAEDLWLCNFDRIQLARVVQNIVLNAHEAMPMGGTVAIAARNTVLEPGAHPRLPAGRYVKVSIHDTGVGIERELMPRVFDPFLSTKRAGSGLGLATAYSIVSKHQGHIDVTSELGVGTTFEILLPAELAAVAQSEDVVPAAHGGSGNILVMDDEAAIRDSLAAVLRSMGYVVTVARDGEEALRLFFEAKATDQPFKAAIFDLTVPGGVGGMEAVARLREAGSDTAVVVSSGYSDDAVMSDPVAFGFTASISKPYQIGDLAALLNELFPESARM